MSINSAMRAAIVGSAAPGDTLNGDDFANVLQGGSGDDVLSGAAGADTLIGGLGNDQLYGGRGVDTAVFHGSHYDYSWSLEPDGFVVRGPDGQDTLTGMEFMQFDDGVIVASQPPVVMTDGPDVYYGGAGNDEVYALGDADIVSGNLGDDTLYGGSGNDTLIGGLGANQLVGGDGNDTLVMGQGGAWPGVLAVGVSGPYGDLAYGGEGTDRLFADFSADARSIIISAKVGNDPTSIMRDASPVGLFDSIESLVITGGQSNDVLYGTSGADTLNGSAGDDFLVGGASFNRLSGDSGDDTIAGGAASDAIFGGTGADTAIYLGSRAAYTVVSLGSGVFRVQGLDGTDTLTSIEFLQFTDQLVALNPHSLIANDPSGAGVSLDGGNTAAFIQGGSGADTLRGGDGADDLVGGLGSDQIFGGASADEIEGGGDGDSLYGGAGDDSISGGAGADYIDGGTGGGLVYGDAGDDVIIVDGGTAFGGVGNDRLTDAAGGGSATLVGGAGDDTIIGDGTTTAAFSFVAGAVLVDLGRTGAQDTGHGHDVLVDVRNLTGSSFDDTLIGDDHDNRLSGYMGDDLLLGRGGDDVLLADLGFDTLDGGAGRDTASFDYVLYTKGIAVGVDWTGEIKTQAGAVTLRSIENLIGGSGDDSLYGGSDANLLSGMNGADVLSGLAGADTLIGGAGNDTLYGGDGRDSMVGGVGDDVYDYSTAQDVIVEQAGEGVDEVRTADVAKIYLYNVSNQVENLTYVGAAAFTGYGNALNNVITGGSANDYLDGLAGADTLRGGAGNDLYIVDNVGDRVEENASSGNDTIRASVDYTLSANVETLELVGSAGRYGTGNGDANTLRGTAFNDTLDGGAGADTLYGGYGDDTYLVDNAGDVVGDQGGVDTVITTLTSLTVPGTVENVTFVGAGKASWGGNNAANVITGAGGADTFYGAAGNDTIYGGGGADVLSGDAGDDALYGGAGDDRYTVDAAGDQVFEAVGGGFDVVTAKVNYTLTAGQEIEQLILGAGATSGTGNAFNNAIVGNGLANLLDGGAGADTLTGGGGNDTYVVDNLGDQVVELAGGGLDTVNAAVSGYVLADNVEAGAYVGAGGGRITGNALANTLTGGAGDDTLDGGAGADRLVGGAGNDVYYVGHPADLVIENANEGHDVVHTTLNTLTLAGNAEDLLFDGAGTFNGTGNGLDNILDAGLASASTLHGGAGSDTLNGGAGADSLYGEAGADVIQGGGGNDYIKSMTGEGPDTIYGDGGNDLLTLERTDALVNLTVDLTLGGLQSVGEGTQFESIEQIRFAGGLGDDFERGGALADVLKGNGGSDTLIGGAGADILQGGLGHDTVTGGTGADTFRFDGPDSANSDVVTDFEHGVDHFALSLSGFGIASLSGVQFVSGSAPAADSAAATLLYDTGTGDLYWDGNGSANGNADKVLLATLTGAPTVTFDDFLTF